MDFEQDRRILVLECRGICCPFVEDGRLYFGTHSGRSIRSVDMEGNNERIEMTIYDSECSGHISSPAVYGDSMIYHGPMKNGGGQRSFRAVREDDIWVASGDGPIGPPYMRDCDAGRLAKDRGLWFSWGEVWPGPFRHAHFHRGWVYYSQWGDEEYIRRRRLDGSSDEPFYRPDIPYQKTKSGAAKHPFEVRDPFINDNYFACVEQGEQVVSVWSL